MTKFFPIEAFNVISSFLTKDPNMQSQNFVPDNEYYSDDEYEEEEEEEEEDYDDSAFQAYMQYAYQFWSQYQCQCPKCGHSFNPFEKQIQQNGNLSETESESDSDSMKRSKKKTPPRWNKHGSRKY